MLFIFALWCHMGHCGLFPNFFQGGRPHAGGYLCGALPGPQLESSADKKSLGNVSLALFGLGVAILPLQTLGHGNRARVHSGIYLSRLVL
jgi:hypothetical protein